MQYATILLIVGTLIAAASCDCGCLKCSKNLRIVSPPSSPCKIIYRGTPCEGRQALDYSIQTPVLPPPIVPIPKAYGYQIQAVEFLEPCEAQQAYDIQIQAPVPPIPKLSLPLTGLIARPDRIVLAAPDCATYNEERPTGRPCRPIYPPMQFYGPAPPSPPAPLFPLAPKPPPCYNRGPILERLPANFYETICPCRYASKRRRNKRHLPILHKSVHFFMHLLPHFLRFPLEQTLKALQPEAPPRKDTTLVPNYILSRLINDNQRKVATPRFIKHSFLEKIEKLNNNEVGNDDDDDQFGYYRKKRSAFILDENGELSLPFLQITDVESAESAEEGAQVEAVTSLRRDDYTDTLDFNHLVPYNPIYYMLNAPIRLLRHIHKFGEQISPVFRSVPEVLTNSRQYLRRFGRNFKNDMLDFASNLIGDFDTTHARHVRSVANRSEPYEPDYTNVFPELSRTKRYILKVVDESEVESFLREKLTGLVEKQAGNVKKPIKSKKLVVEKLNSKIIIDNNGRPFVEINGVKRPLFFRKNDTAIAKKINNNSNNKKISEEETIETKISNVIEKAKERLDQSSGDGVELHRSEVAHQLIQERINQVVDEIQAQINLNFDDYAQIYANLSKLERFKRALVGDWKRILVGGGANEMAGKIRILNSFQQMQLIRDTCVNDIINILHKKETSNFIAAKLTKILVRLQKLQCLIYRIVEEFEETIKVGAQFNTAKEIKFIDYLSMIGLVGGGSQIEEERRLREQRDVDLESQLALLVKMRALLSANDKQRIFNEARLLWEMKNIEKLRKSAIEEMRTKLEKGHKVRKEMRILFDLLKQAEACQEKQKRLFNVTVTEKRDFGEVSGKPNKMTTDIIRPAYNQYHQPTVVYKNTLFTNKNNGRKYVSRTILEDKKPIRLVSNGYTMTAYKVSDSDAL